jgi:polar amino acid transport system substrate-binding protein
MRKLVSVLGLPILGVLGLAGCGSTANSPTGGAATGSGATATSCSYSGLQKDLFKSGTLTVATDTPAYPPWFENNKPSDGRGYESAVAYAVATQLGFKASQVHWVVESFDSSYAPGPKSFDFDINEISYTAQRATAVSFSTSYYDVTQALVALKSSPIVTHHTPADLRTYVYGDQIGTTSLALIESALHPTHTPAVLNTLNDVKTALQDHVIQAFVIDTPTAQYIAGAQIPNSELVAQFPASGEYYALLFAKGDPLVGCVDQALSTLRSNRTLAHLQHEYLGIYTAFPTIQP